MLDYSMCLGADLKRGLAKYTIFVRSIRAVAKRITCRSRFLILDSWQRSYVWGRLKAEGKEGDRG